MFVSYINSLATHCVQLLGGLWDFSFTIPNHSLSMNWNSTSPLSFLSNSPLHISYKFWIVSNFAAGLYKTLQLNVIEGSTWFAFVVGNQ